MPDPKSSILRFRLTVSQRKENTMLTDRTKRLAGFWPALIVLLFVLLAAPVPAAPPAG